MKARRNVIAKTAKQTLKEYHSGKILPITADEVVKKLNATKETNFELLLQDARKEAAKNGLTVEILNRLLNEEN